MITIEEKSPVKMPGLTSLFITFDINNQIIEILHNIECRYYNPKTYEWEIPVTYLSTLIEKFNKIDDITLQKEEVQDIKWCPVKDIIKQINNNYENLTSKIGCWEYLIKYFEFIN